LSLARASKRCAPSFSTFWIWRLDSTGPLILSSSTAVWCTEPSADYT